MSPPLLQVFLQFLLLLSLTPIAAFPHALQTERWALARRHCAPFERPTLWPFLALDADLLWIFGCFFCAWMALDEFEKSAPALDTGQLQNYFPLFASFVFAQRLLHTLGKFHLFSPKVQCASRRHVAVFPAQQLNFPCKPQNSWLLWVRMMEIMIRM